MTYNQQIIDRLDRAYSGCPIILDDLGFEDLLHKAYAAIWLYAEYHRAECILDGLYQRFGYAELAPDQKEIDK
jgi:hypothetical protein